MTDLYCIFSLPNISLPILDAHAHFVGSYLFLFDEENNHNMYVVPNIYDLIDNLHINPSQSCDNQIHYNVKFYNALKF